MRAALAFLALAGCSEMVQAPLDQDTVFKAIGAGNTCIEQGKSDNDCTYVCEDLYQHEDERLSMICRNAVKASLETARKESE